LKYEDDADISSDILVEFRERLKKYINDSFAKYVSRIVEVREEEERASLINPDSHRYREKDKNSTREERPCRDPGKRQ